MATANWMCLLGLALVSIGTVSYGIDTDSPDMTYPPLLKFGIKEAGDNDIRSFDSSKEVKLDFNISYFGSSYQSLFVSSDGLVSFVPNVRFLEGVTWSEGIRNAGADRPFLAPFYHEGYNPVSMGHESYQGKLFYRVIYKEKLATADATKDTHYSYNLKTMNYFSQYIKEAVINNPSDFTAEMVAVVTWKDVTDKKTARSADCDATNASPCKGATFQAIIIADKTRTFTIFNYLKMDIPYESSYQSGFNGGYDRGWYNVIPCHGACSVALNKSRVNDLPILKGSDLKGRYFLDVGGEEIVRGGCLPNNLRAGMLELYPLEVGMFGGEKLEVSGKCLQATSQIYCKFGASADSPVTTGVMSNTMKGYCPVPLLTTRGPIKVSWSSDGQDWVAEKHITVVVPERVQEPVAVSAADKEAWYTRTASSITVSWSAERMSAKSNARVEIKLIGYRETGGQVEYKDLEKLGDTANSNGRYTFKTSDYACITDCKDFDMGLLEVGLAKNYYDDAASRVAIRYGPIPLGWYVDEQLTKEMGSDWSNQMCTTWYNEDKKDMNWHKNLETCPCSLDQALADFGRWQADSSCDLFDNSKCYYHKDAIHCVRSVNPTPDGAGNQCCYNRDGTLLYSQLAYTGSTPDRGHPWGAAPYSKPYHVPSLSHWKYDVVPYYHCCLWNDNAMCDLYVKQRPTTDCAAYQVPGLALVRGDPHITTFDGQTYNLGGKGDFWLVDTDEVSIQGRFQARRGSWDLGRLRKTDKTSWKPTALTSLSIQGLGSIIELHPSPANAIQNRGLDIRVGSKRYFFLTETSKWQEFKGHSILNNAKNMYNNAHDNFTIFTNNIGINVYAVNDLLHVTVVVPPSMKRSQSAVQGMGLLGMFDGIGDNDYVSTSNTVSSPGTEPKKLYTNFGMSWAVGSQDSLFPFNLAPATLTAYTPYFAYNDIPNDFTEAPTDSMISSVCDKDENCKWDYRITGSRKVAKATKDADELFAYSQGSAYLVQSCGLPAIGSMSVLNKYNLSVGQEITVTGCGEGHSFDGQATFKCVQERLDVAKEAGRETYGRQITDNQIDYIVHWVPQPFQVCSESIDDAGLYMYIGIGAGAAVLIIIVIVVVVICMRKKKSSRNVEKPRPADRVRKGGRRDEGTDEPMITHDRNPVYKPSRHEAPSSSAV